MLTVSINQIISSHRGGGYNIKSLRNLRQNKAEKVETLGMIDNSKASKYRKILTNWFICNERDGKEKSDLRRETATNKGLAKLAVESKLKLSSSNDNYLNSPPPSPSLERWWQPQKIIPKSINQP